MIQKYNKYKILQEFFDFPTKNFHAREISRNTKIALPSTFNYLKELEKEKLIVKEKKDTYPSYKANRESNLFKIYKKNDIIIKIFNTGLIDYIYDACVPDAIILFGSASKGEDTEGSDIDLFIQSPEKKLNLERFEKILKREITPFFKEDFSKLNKELKNNILNGIIIKGFLRVFK